MLVLPSSVGASPGKQKSPRNLQEGNAALTLDVTSVHQAPPGVAGGTLASVLS